MKVYSRGSKGNLIELILSLLLYGASIYLASKIFKGFYVESYWYAVLTAIVILILNKLLKPLLKILTLPITILTLGLLYPIVDTIILKIASSLMGEVFTVEGWLIPFFVSIFITIITFILDAVITKPLMEG